MNDEAELARAAAVSEARKTQKRGDFQSYLETMKRLAELDALTPRNCRRCLVTLDRPITREELDEFKALKLPVPKV